MAKQSKSRRTATLWKWGTKWDKQRGWIFAGCSLVQPYRGPMMARPLDGMVETFKKAFGASKHRAARILRFAARQGQR